MPGTTAIILGVKQLLVVWSEGDLQHGKDKYVR